MEASIALPVFVICMAALLQFGRVSETAERFGSALCETAEQMAVYAGVSNYEEGNAAVLHGLSAIYARGQVLGRAGDTKAVKNTNFLLSSFLKDGEMIDLVLTYQMQAPVGESGYRESFLYKEEVCAHGAGGTVPAAVKQQRARRIRFKPFM